MARKRSILHFLHSHWISQWSPLFSIKLAGIIRKQNASCMLHHVLFHRLILLQIFLWILWLKIHFIIVLTFGMLLLISQPADFDFLCWDFRPISLGQQYIWQQLNCYMHLYCSLPIMFQICVSVPICLGVGFILNISRKQLTTTQTAVEQNPIQLQASPSKRWGKGSILIILAVTARNQKQKLCFKNGGRSYLHLLSLSPITSC